MVLGVAFFFFLSFPANIYLLTNPQRGGGYIHRVYTYLYPYILTYLPTYLPSSICLLTPCLTLPTYSPCMDTYLPVPRQSESAKWPIPPRAVSLSIPVGSIPSNCAPYATTVGLCSTNVLAVPVDYLHNHAAAAYRT